MNGSMVNRIVDGIAKGRMSLNDPQEGGWMLVGGERTQSSALVASLNEQAMSKAEENVNQKIE